LIVFLKKMEKEDFESILFWDKPISKQA